MSHATPQKVVLDGGAQPMRFVPVDYRNARETRVAACSYTIIDTTEGTTSSSREVVASTAATLDSASNATSGAVGRSAANPALVSLNDASGYVEGRTYVISSLNDDGERETFVARSVNATSNTVTATRPLSGSYATGALVRGIEFEASFPASVADDEDLAIQDGRQYEIRWSYTIDGHDHVIAQPIEVHRTRVTPWASPEDLFRRVKHLKAQTSPQDQADKLAAATEHVIAEIEGAGLPVESFRTSSVGVQAVIFDALYMLLEDMPGDRNSDRAEVFRERYKAQVHKLTEQKNAGAHIVSRHDDEKKPQGDKLDLFVPT